MMNTEEVITNISSQKTNSIEVPSSYKKTSKKDKYSKPTKRQVIVRNQMKHFDNVPMESRAGMIGDIPFDRLVKWDSCCAPPLHAARSGAHDGSQQPRGL